MIRLLAFCLLFSFAPYVSAQSPTAAQDPVAEQVMANKFRQSLLRAANEAAKSGEIRRVDVIKLRVASLSPAFLEQAQQLAVIQMSMSGEDLGDLPVNDDGKIEVSRIDWEGLITFLERLIPLILKMIDLFAMNLNIHQHYAVDIARGPTMAPDFVLAA
jgi:hypothetical protein